MALRVHAGRKCGRGKWAEPVELEAAQHGSEALHKRAFVGAVAVPLFLETLDTSLILVDALHLQTEHGRGKDGEHKRFDNQKNSYNNGVDRRMGKLWVGWRVVVGGQQ